METYSEPGKDVLKALERRASGNTQYPKEMEGSEGQPKVGDVVLVVDQNAPRGKWHLGRVEEVFQGQDGRVRVVQVSTRGQTFIRPITRLCSLNVAGQPEDVS